MEKRKVRVLFVCLGNICRSLTAQGVFETLVEDEGLDSCIEVDSAGCGRWHIGEPPDERAVNAAIKRGIDISRQRGRTVETGDFRTFDYILAMDKSNLDHLLNIAPKDSSAEVRLFMEYAPRLKRKEVPDPYTGGPRGFERVLDMIEAASAGLLSEIKKTL